MDCGPQINPDRIRSQAEGACIMGASLALTGEISFKNGVAQQNNFHEYQVMRMEEAPRDIRVHMAALRHPCVGDLTYGADPALAERAGVRRQWLHALSLAFDHPGTGERTVVTSPYPPDLAESLDRLRAGV